MDTDIAKLGFLEYCPGPPQLQDAPVHRGASDLPLLRRASGLPLLPGASYCLSFPGSDSCFPQFSHADQEK